MDDERVIIDPVDGDSVEGIAAAPGGDFAGGYEDTAARPGAAVAEEGPAPNDDGLLSPLGEVQTRTRSARKKRKQQEHRQRRDSEGKEVGDDEDHDDDDDADERKEEEEDGPRKKRARTAVAAPVGADDGEEDSPRRRARVFDEDFQEEEEDESSKGEVEDGTMGSSSERGGDRSVGVDTDARTAAVAVATAAPTRRDVMQLRIPAHQTPGKGVASSSTAVGRRLAAGAAAKELQYDDLPAPSRRAFDLRKSVPAKSATTTVTLKAPPASSAVQVSGASDEPEKVHEENSVGQPIDEALGKIVEVVLPNVFFWLFLLVAALALLGPLQWVTSVANRTTPLPASRPPANESLLHRVAELEQIHENLEQDLMLKREEINGDLQRFMDERTSLVAAVQDHAAVLQHKSAEASDAIREARAHPLVHEHDLTFDQIASQDIRTLQSLVHGSIVDVSFLSSWQSLPAVEEMSCSAPPADSVVVSEELQADLVAALQKKAQQLQLAATVSAIEITGNSSLEETYRKWIRQEVLEYEDDDGVVPIGTDTYFHLVERNQKLVQAVTGRPGSTGAATQAAVGPSEEAIQRIIDARMEVEKADQTGRVDYASVLNGAAVIRGGERGTSPSLVDHLPLANRLARLWSIRHYGHGPAAALTPSDPPYTALGHCWSFTKDPSAAKQSGYATLTVQLAKPVRVQAVSVEHPPQDITDRIQTAIQNFRVVGYEFPNAQGMAWPLGSFEYRVGGDIRQEYVAKTEVKGEEVPILQSVSLLIDSNWGANYTCLYRFRVFGSEQ